MPRLSMTLNTGLQSLPESWYTAPNIASTILATSSSFPALLPCCSLVNLCVCSSSFGYSPKQAKSRRLSAVPLLPRVLLQRTLLASSSVHSSTRRQLFSAGWLWTYRSCILSLLLVSIGQQVSSSVLNLLVLLDDTMLLALLLRGRGSCL